MGEADLLLRPPRLLQQLVDGECLYQVPELGQRRRAPARDLRLGQAAQVGRFSAASDPARGGGLLCLCHSRQADEGCGIYALDEPAFGQVLVECALQT